MTTAEIISTTVIFFLIMDPLGNIPLFLSVLKNVPEERRLKITLRELLIAYVVLLIYLFFGRYILDVLALSNEAIAISGGIILFLIAIRMIFPTSMYTIAAMARQRESTFVRTAHRPTAKAESR